MKRELSGVNICFETSQIWARTQLRPSGQSATLSDGSSGNIRPVAAARHRLGVLKWRVEKGVLRLVVKDINKKT